MNGEDLAAEPTLAFLAMIAALEIRCCEVALVMVVRRRAEMGEAVELVVVVELGLDARVEVKSVDLRGWIGA